MRKLVFIFIILLNLFYNGCSGPIGDFFSVRYQNVMGYFNTYYNAKRNFDEAILELKKNPPKDLDTNYFAQYIATPNVKTKFNLVLEKASKILQFYPRSKWFDDALMMIGEVYYYEDEGDLAIRKFEELIQNFPNSKHVWKAHSLYARTLYYGEEYDKAITYIDKILPEATEKDEDIALELILLKAQIYYEQAQYEKAIKSLNDALKIDGDEYLLALSVYLNGRIHEVIQDYSSAKSAFASVLDYDPDVELEFKAKLSYAKMLRELGDYENALMNFLKLKKDVLSKDKMAYIDLEIAVTYEKMGELETALLQYETVDSLYQKTDASAKSFYYRGLLYEAAYDYNEAKFYYDKAKVEFTQSEITPIAQKKSDVISKLIQCKSELLKFDSLYLKLTDTTNLIKDTTEVKSDSINSKLMTTDSTNTDIVDTLLTQKIDTLKEDLLLEPEEPGLINQDKKIEVIVNPSSQNLTPDSVLFLITKNQMELATIFFLDLGLLDSAEFWISKVLESKYSSYFAPKAYYSLVEIYKIKGNTEKADSIYNKLITEYPKSDYAKFAKKIKGINEIEETEGEPLYNKALNVLDKKPQEAIKLLKKVCSSDSNSLYCMKSIYTTGWIYENIIKNNDSAKFYYKILINKFPQSQYAQEIVGKVTVAEDTSKLSQVIKVKEIIPPPPPRPKYVQTGQADSNRENVQQRRDIRSRDSREEEYEEPEIEEPDSNDEEPPE